MDQTRSPSLSDQPRYVGATSGDEGKDLVTFLQVCRELFDKIEGHASFSRGRNYEPQQGITSTRTSCWSPLGLAKFNVSVENLGVVEVS